MFITADSVRLKPPEILPLSAAEPQVRERKRRVRVRRVIRPAEEVRGAQRR